MTLSDLKRFLRGQVKLDEVSLGSSTPGGAGLPPQWSGRQERLSQSWMDIVIRLEAIAQDVLDISEDVYYECLPILKDIRAAACEMVHEQLSRFNGLLAILQRYVSVHAEMAIQVTRMQQLCIELQYVCDEISPRDPKVPEAPPRKKDDWAFQTLGKKKPDVTFSAPGGEDQWESTLRGHLKGKDLPEGSPSMVPSLVMSSLARAADSVAESRGDLDARFLRAGDAIRLCLESYTDVDTADVEVGCCVPGSTPRLDLNVRWKGSDVVGRCSMYWVEDGKSRKLCIEGLKDDALSMTENLSDAQVASRIYGCLDSVLDYRPVAARIGVVPTLYRVMERARRGLDVSESSVEQILAGLCATLALSEAVSLPVDGVKLRCESFGADIWAWFYDWEYEEEREHEFSAAPAQASDRSDLSEGMKFSNLRLKGKITPTDGAISEYRKNPGLLTKAVYAAAAYAKKRHADMVVVPGNSMMASIYHIAPATEDLKKYTVMSTTAHVMLVKVDGSVYECDAEPETRLKESALLGAYESPRLRINLESGTVAIVGPDEEEEVLPRDTKDEDVTARLLSMAWQKENVMRGHVVEGVRIDQTEWEAELSGMLREEEDWKPQEHPRNLNTGEFVDAGSANTAQRKAAKSAGRKKKPAQDGEVRTMNPVPPKKHPFATEPKEVPAQELPQQTPDQTQPVTPVGNTVQTPPVPNKITPPQPILDPMGNPVGYLPVPPVLPPPETTRQPLPPRKGKEMDFDTPFAQPKKDSESPQLPDAPADKKKLKKVAVPNDRVGISTHEQPEEPTDDEKKKNKPQPVIPQPPKGGGVRRNNPDLDAAFGFAPPAGEPQPPASPTQGTASPSPTKTTTDAEATQAVQGDQELSSAAQGEDLGSESSDVVQQLAALLQELLAAQQSNPQDPELPKRSREFVSVAGNAARKKYARDLVKARDIVNNLPPDRAPKTAQERIDLIKQTAEEIRAKREEWWDKVASRAEDFFTNTIMAKAQWTLDMILDLSDIDPETIPEK